MTPLLEEELVELEITQGDRDAAVEAARSLEIERWATGSGYFAALLVQAFARHRLTTIRDLRARVEWRTIETCPRDGTYVLLHFDGPINDSESPGVSVGKSIHGDGWWLTAIWAASVAHHQPSGWLPLPPVPEMK